MGFFMMICLQKQSCRNLKAKKDEETLQQYRADQATTCLKYIF